MFNLHPFTPGLLYFIVFGAFACLMPFLSLLLQSKGYNASQIGEKRKEMMIKDLFLFSLSSLSFLFPFAYSFSIVGYLLSTSPVISAIASLFWMTVIDYLSLPIYKKGVIFFFCLFTSLSIGLIVFADHFFLLLILFALHTFIRSPLATLLDTLTLLSSTQEERTDSYGKTRLFGAIGWGVNKKFKDLISKELE